MRMNEHFIGALQVEISQSRWRVTTRILDADGNELGKFIASADSALTYGDGIWFGTAEEYREAIARGGF